MVSAFESLRAHESFWPKVVGVAELPTWGSDPIAIPEAAAWDYQALALQARHDITEIEPLLQTVLEPAVLAQLLDDSSQAGSELDDELWVGIVYAFATAAHLGRAGVDHLADMFAPLYMWRAAAFMAKTADDSSASVQARLNSLCETFERLKPVLVAAWSADV